MSKKYRSHIDLSVVMTLFEQNLPLTKKEIIDIIGEYTRFSDILSSLKFNGLITQIKPKKGKDRESRYIHTRYGLEHCEFWLKDLENIIRKDLGRVGLRREQMFVEERIKLERNIVMSDLRENKRLKPENNTNKL